MANDALKPSAIGAGLPRPAGNSTSGVQQSGSVPTKDRVAQGSPELGSAGAGGEKVRISNAAHELLRQSELMGKARETLDSQSEVRKDRVAEVRARLEAGVYDTKAVKDELALRLTSILGDLPYRDLPTKPE